MVSLGDGGASYDAPGGGALGGGPHLYRGLLVDIQDFPLQSHGCGKEAPGVVPRPQSQGQGTSKQDMRMFATDRFPKNFTINYRTHKGHKQNMCTRDSVTHLGF